MLRSYKYVQTDHSLLNEYVLSFFRSIENENGEFTISLFETDFRNIVNRHPRIIKRRFKAIYDELNKLPQADKAFICRRIVESNNIEAICRGDITPLRYDEFPEPIKDNLKDLFIVLYENTLKESTHFHDKYGTLQEHFIMFKSENENVVCPACGLNKVKTQYDRNRDQYDHYLPKSIYPLSSVNFKNLVPICTECNSFEVKGNKDVLRETTGKLFFPYDDNHGGINIEIFISVDAPQISDITWDFGFSTLHGQTDEIESWKYIFNIESRYTSFINGHIEKWYKACWQCMNDHRLQVFTLEERLGIYLDVFLKADEDNEINFIKRPALNAFLHNSVSLRAELEAQYYSFPEAETPCYKAIEVKQSITA